MIRHRAHRRGLTLLEIMVAISVLLVIMLMSLTAMNNALTMRELLEERDSTTRSARVVMSKLRRELQLAYLTPNRTAVETYQTVFVGMDDSPDMLYFASLSHERLYRDSRESDQTEITIWAESGTDGGYTLYHREAPRIDHEPDVGGTVLPLAHKVRSFELRYLDQQADEWRDEWDTRSTDTPYRLPRAVQIGLVLIGTDPEDRDRTVDLPFLTTVTLEYSAPYGRSAPLAVGAPATTGASRGAGRGRGTTGRMTRPARASRGVRAP